MLCVTTSPCVCVADIYCYECDGDGQNSTCADPYTPVVGDDRYPVTHCYVGACVKLVYYEQGKTFLASAATIE